MTDCLRELHAMRMPPRPPHTSLSTAASLPSVQLRDSRETAQGFQLQQARAPVAVVPAVAVADCGSARAGLSYRQGVPAPAVDQQRRRATVDVRSLRKPTQQQTVRRSRGPI